MSKDARLHLRLSSEELTLVKDAAGRAGKPVSRYVRDVVLSDAEVDQVIPAVSTIEAEAVPFAGKMQVVRTPECINAAFHRKGTFCKRCGSVS